MISKVNKQINPKTCINRLVSQCAVMYHSITICKVMKSYMYQTTQGYRNPFNSRRPQYHVSIDTRGNNGPL